MAVLEAFMHDPLMHWRLGTKESPAEIGPAGMPGEGGRRRSIIATLDHPDLLRLRNESSDGDEQNDSSRKPEAQNERALQVLERVKAKLTGMSVLSYIQPFLVPAYS